jgi:hypothetical protein
MPRFVCLEHDHPFLHWDFMLEAGAALRTWRLASPPQPGAILEATSLGDHRLAYLDYEGPVSGNRGSVTRWEHGTYELIEETADTLVVRLRGHKISGTATLARRQAAPWTFTFAQEADGP